jgi:hypothetical protein
MLSINQVKNVALENITFPANSVILMRYSERETNNGGIDTTIKYIAIDGVKDTKTITAVKVLLAALIAEFKTMQEFNSEFATIKDNGKVISERSGIQAKRIITPFLSGNTIYRTDSDGKLSGALECEKGVRLRDTALNVRSNQAVTTLNHGELRAAIHNQSAAIVKQARYLTTIDQIKTAILIAISDEKAEREAKKEAEKQEKGATNKAKKEANEMTPKEAA